MKRVAALALALASPAAAQLGANNYAVDAPMARPAGARLVWRDEFDRPTLDPARWRYDASMNAKGWANRERQYYAAHRRENVRIENGRLVIEARAERLKGRADYGGQDYSSGRIDTQGRAAWTYGYFEVRAKLPCGRGTWPAIWMMPANGPWPDTGEIDIMEHVGFDPTRVHATLHSALFVHTKGTQRGATITVPTACTEFHTYQLDWRPDAITAGVDGRAYMRIRNDRPGGRGAWPFDTPFHLILNLAMGGDWGGQKGIDDTALPQRMEVDWVRVWERRR